jgi:hypothetical protein
MDENTPLYLRNYNPVPTPAERDHALMLENTTLRMRLAVVTEALRAAEAELTHHRLGECEWASSGVTLQRAVVHDVFAKRELPE